MPGSVLVLTYEYPPAGGAGVQRVAKFTRYLPEHGWHPVVVASEPIEGRPRDESLLAEVSDVTVARIPPRDMRGFVARRLAVLKRLYGGAREPGAVEAAATGAPAAPASSGSPRRRPLSSRIASWLAVPDPAALWIPKAAEAAVALGQAHEVDVVFASGPPFSVLIAGAQAARALRVPFVADLRDAWESNPEFQGPTSWHRRRSLAKERWVMRHADLVLAAAEPVVDEARTHGARRAEHVPNGFDASEMPAWDPSPAGPFTIAFMGRFYSGHDPGPFLAGLARAIGRGADVRLEVVGPRDAVAEAAVADLGIEDHVVFHGYRPHAEALSIVAAADAGLVVLNDEACARATYPAKLYEYLGIGLPVLAVGPVGGVTPRLVERLRAGWTVSEDPDAVAAAIDAAAGEKATASPADVPSSADVAHLDRRALTSRLGALLDTLAEQ